MKTSQIVSQVVLRWRHKTAVQPRISPLHLWSNPEFNFLPSNINILKQQWFKSSFIFISI